MYTRSQMDGDEINSERSIQKSNRVQYDEEEFAILPVTKGSIKRLLYTEFIRPLVK